MNIVITEPHKASNPLLDRVAVETGDVTRRKADALLTVIPQSLEVRGSLNKSIMKAAGERLDSFILDNIYRPRPGDVYAVPGFGLSCRHILIGVVPNWRAEFEKEDRHLLTCVRRSLKLAREMDLKTVIVPPLCTGRRGYPLPRATRLIVQGIIDRLDEGFKSVKIVCKDDAKAAAFRERLEAAR